MWELVIFLVGFVLGWLLQARRVGRVFLEDPQRVIDILEKIHSEEPQADSHEYRTEWINDQCYLWHADTGEFLGQGKDPQAVLDQLKSPKTWRERLNEDHQST